MRALLALSLAILVALTSQSLAIARGQAAATGQMVICSGGQVVTVSVDADGNPTGPAHICPDCALHVLDLSASTRAVGFVPVCSRAAPARTGAALALGPALIAPKARAPPLRT